jgi:DNA-binding XRE family transcriptional regulator
MPRKLISKKICFYFNISEQDLFGPHATIKPLNIKALQPGPNEKYSEINNTVAIGNRLLFGLMYAGQLKSQAVADSIGINLKTMQRILYTNKDPSDEIKKDLSELFCIPIRILFNTEYRCRKKQ